MYFLVKENEHDEKCKNGINNFSICFYIYYLFKKIRKERIQFGTYKLLTKESKFGVGSHINSDIFLDKLTKN
jgi:hypothetical protein